MNILVLGSGGREHALAWKIKQSEHCDQLFVAPGNGGTGSIATNLDINVNDKEGVATAIRENSIDLIVIGPEDPLVKGMVDFLKTQKEFNDLLIVGPSAEGAKLEGSKDFAKQFMIRHNIPTGKARVFNKENLEEGKHFLSTFEGPYVLKADGLAAGKGVIITSDLSEAKESLETLINGQFGEASANVLVEEFLDGIELSVFVLTDGEDYVILPEAKDYKRIGEGDTGPNTGGMGAVSPVGFADSEFMRIIEDQIVKPTINGLKEEQFDFKGFVFFGLINVGGQPKVIEYNVRMGDPETEVVMPRIKSDLVPLLKATAQGKLAGSKIEFEEFTATTVMLVSGGYPGPYPKGINMAVGLQDDDSTTIFHAGTKLNGEDLVTNGGRVIAVTGRGKDMDQALKNSYQGVAKIDWEGVNFRKDIGFDLRQQGQ